MTKVLTKNYLDQSNVVLTLTLDNSQPIELGAFVNAFTSLASDYRRSLEESGLDGNAEIFVTEVRSGSIIADLLPMVTTAFPVIASSMAQVGQAVDFVNGWKDRFEKLTEGIVPSGLSRSDLKVIANTVEAVARDPNASQKLEVVTFEDNKRQVKAAFKFDTSSARHISETIEGEFRRLDEKSDVPENRVLMYFTRSDIGNVPIDKRSGEKVVISSISDKALPIMYASSLAEQRIKHEIREARENIFKKAFSVDVSVEYRGEKPIVYKILEVHQILDLPDDT